MNRIEINPCLLRWAREAMNMDHAAVARAAGSGVRAERIAEWETGASQPTIRQLERVAKKLLRDAAFFVGDEVPSEEPALVSFRRVFNAPDATPSPELLREIAAAQARRDDLLDIWEDLDVTPRGVELRLTLADTAEVAAGKVRDWSGVDVRRQFEVPSPHRHLRVWIDAVEAHGTLVFHASRVPVEEFRGLAIPAPVASIIVLNGADGVEPRIFTLLHELVHLGLGKSDWSSHPLDRLASAGSDDIVETFCNRVAAELILPAELVRACIADTRKVDLPLVREVAGAFRVSQAVAAIRLAQLDLISEMLLGAVLRQSRAPGKRSSGGSFYRTQVRNIGRRYTADVLEAVYAGRISHHAAASMLGARRVHGLDSMRAALGGA